MPDRFKPAHEFAGMRSPVTFIFAPFPPIREGLKGQVLKDCTRMINRYLTGFTKLDT
jgi:hypothetical protein